MLRQVYILKNEVIFFEKAFSKGINQENLKQVYQEIIKSTSPGLEADFRSYDYLKYKIYYTSESKYNLFFIFITGIYEDPKRVKRNLTTLKKEFIFTFKDNLDNLDTSLIEILNPLIESFHKNLETKISLVGYSGVGKTTITRLISFEEIPSIHVPTITGKVSKIKIGKLYFNLWDFAGQEQFSYLWNDFIFGSDAVLIITDSSLENVEKSRVFVELIKENAPYAETAVIGNKQDLPEAMNIDRIEEILGVKTYSMIAIDENNHNKMIQVVSGILEINTDVSPLLSPLFERDRLIALAKESLENGEIPQAADYFDKISDICLDLGDDALCIEFSEKAKKLKRYLK